MATLKFVPMAAIKKIAYLQSNMTTDYSNLMTRIEDVSCNGYWVDEELLRRYSDCIITSMYETINILRLINK